MQSARSILRRASRRIRRSSRQQQSEERTSESVEQVALAKELGEAESNADTSGMSSGSGPVVGQESDLIAAAAAKLSDLESISSTEDVQDQGNRAQAQLASSKNLVDQLFLQQRRELRSELQAIQDSHRPVTKGDQRRLLDRFLRQHLHGEDISDSTSEDSNEGSSPRRRRRNGIVVQELEGLMEQQSVTQRLRCPRFRRDLENMVRGVVCRQEREVQAALRLRTVGLPGNRHTSPLVNEGGAAETSSQVSGVSEVSSLSSLAGVPALFQEISIPAPPPPPPAPGQYVPPPSPPPFNLAAVQQRPQPQPRRQQQPQPQPRQQAMPQAAPQAVQQPSNNFRGPLPSVPWLVQNSVARDNQGDNRANVLQQHHREAIISDISELVHRQLVHASLASNFRGTLEHLMMNRLDTTDSDGERVMNYINSIRPSQHIRRNDFSHLGIHVRTPEQEAAEVASAAHAGGAVPAAIMQEMSHMRSQMNMLQEMVRMSMEMQLDLQRAIRQEVSAALHQQNGTVPSSSSPSSQPASEGNCIICLDKEVDAVLYQCGHMCVCLTCGLRLSSMGSHCPMCRAPIRDVIRAYRSQQE